MSISVENLLKPRRKVMIDFPGNTLRVGDILEMEIGEKEVWIIQRTGNKYYWSEYVPTFPEFFKEMAWYEDRQEGEMPEYVRDENGVYKVQEWHLELATKVTVFINPNIHKGYTEDCDQCPLYSEFIPATLEEYNAYINSLTDKKQKANE